MLIRFIYSFLLLRYLVLILVVLQAKVTAARDFIDTSSTNTVSTTEANAARDNLDNTVNDVGNTANNLPDTIATGTVDTANTIATGTVNLANTIATGTVNLANTIATGTVDTANTVATGTVNLANTIATGTVDTANTVANWTVTTAPIVAKGVVDAATDISTWSAATIRDSANKVCYRYDDRDGMSYSSGILNMKNSGWQLVGRVVSGGAVKLSAIVSSVQFVPRKYKVMYRLDPRFTRPQVFIKRFNYDTQEYISDFQEQDNGVLVRYNTNSDIALADKAKAFDDYVMFKNRPKIRLNDNEVITINLMPSEEFFAEPTDNKLVSITAETGLPDNQLLFAIHDNICAFLRNYTEYDEKSTCPVYERQRYYKLTDDKKSVLYGTISSNRFMLSNSSYEPCDLSKAPAEQKILCKYINGAGMQIKVGNNIIKPSNKMLPLMSISEANGQIRSLYYTGSAGELDFVNEFPYPELKPLAASSSPSPTEASTTAATSATETTEASTTAATSATLTLDQTPYIQFLSQLPTDTIKKSAEYAQYVSGQLTNGILTEGLYAGKYFFEVIIGYIPNSDYREYFKLEYLISEDTPSDGATGVTFYNNAAFNANSTGYLWVKSTAINNQISGNINIELSAYMGKGVAANELYHSIVEPITQKVYGITRIIYTKLQANGHLGVIATRLVTIYIIIYGLFFLAGAVQLSVLDMTGRIAKIALVFAIFKTGSWTYFHDYFFAIFMEGITQLMSEVNGTTSSIGNPLGFIDPILDRFTNPSFWALMCLQLMQTANGATAGALIAIISIVIYLTGMAYVVITYLVSIIGISVIICIAPILVVFVLFKPTREIFENSISLCFSYLIQPFIFLIFFLFIDGLMATQIKNAVVESCLEPYAWAFNLDLKHFGVDLSFKIPLPAFDVFPIFQGKFANSPSSSEVRAVLEGASMAPTLARIFSASLMLICYAKIAFNMQGYVASIVSTLTHVSSGTHSAAGKALFSDISAAAHLAKDTLGITMSIATQPILNEMRGKKDDDDDGQPMTEEALKKKKEAKKAEIQARYKRALLQAVQRSSLASDTYSAYKATVESAQSINKIAEVTKTKKTLGFIGQKSKQYAMWSLTSGLKNSLPGTLGRVVIRGVNEAANVLKSELQQESKPFSPTPTTEANSPQLDENASKPPSSSLQSLQGNSSPQTPTAQSKSTPQASKSKPQASKSKPRASKSSTGFFGFLQRLFGKK